MSPCLREAKVLRGWAADMRSVTETMEGEAASGFVAPACPWPVDIGHLRRFTMGDRSLEREVLGLYADEIPRRLEALRHSATDNEWRMAAHTLKGSSRAVGAWQVATLAQNAERIVGPQVMPDRQLAVAMIEQAAAEVLAYIEVLAAGEGIEGLKRSA